jgi:hypothetical protein
MATIDELEARAMNERAEWLDKLFDGIDLLKAPDVRAVFKEFDELVAELEAAEKDARYLDAAHACEELADIFLGRGMTIAAMRFDEKAKGYRYESRIQSRARTRAKKREGR